MEFVALAGGLGVALVFGVAVGLDRKTCQPQQRRADDHLLDGPFPFDRLRGGRDRHEHGGGQGGGGEVADAAAHRDVPSHVCTPGVARPLVNPTGWRLALRRALAHRVDAGEDGIRGVGQTITLHCYRLTKCRTIGILNNFTMPYHRHVMRSLGVVLFAVLLVAASAGAASAACYADYKAKQDEPLRLQYGVFEVSGACNRRSAARELRPLLLADGWQLLEVVSVFDESGLEERREDAGRFFLRY